MYVKGRAYSSAPLDNWWLLMYALYNYFESVVSTINALQRDSSAVEAQHRALSKLVVKLQIQVSAVRDESANPKSKEFRFCNEVCH